MSSSSDESSSESNESSKQASEKDPADPTRAPPGLGPKWDSGFGPAIHQYGPALQNGPPTPDRTRPLGGGDFANLFGNQKFGQFGGYQFQPHNRDSFDAQLRAMQMAQGMLQRGHLQTQYDYPGSNFNAMNQQRPTDMYMSQLLMQQQAQSASARTASDVNAILPVPTTDMGPKNGDSLEKKKSKRRHRGGDDDDKTRGKKKGRGSED